MSEFESLDIMKKLDYGNYAVNQKGVYLVNTETDKSRRICMTPVVPVRRLRDIFTGKYSTEVAAYKGEWLTYIYQQSILFTPSKLSGLGDDMMDVATDAKQLTKYFAQMCLDPKNYATIPEALLIDRMGWVDGGFSPFLTECVFNGEANCREYFDAVQPHGSRDTWVDAMKKVRARKTPMRVMLAAAFASTVLYKCTLQPFFLHLWGTTENGKTVALMVAASVWANPINGAYISTFNATNLGLELVASFLNDLPMCIDELEINNSRGIKDYDDILYGLTEGTGRTKSDRESKLRERRKWRCCFLTTGEHPITNGASNGGAVNRAIEIEAEDELFPDLPWLANTLKDNYGHAGPEFIRYLQEGDNEQRLKQFQREAYNALQQNNATSKQAMAASAIIAADRLATELFFNDGMELTADDFADVLSTKDEVDPNRRAYSYLIDLVGRSIMHFKKDEYGNYKVDTWGKIAKDKVFFIKSVFDREIAFAGFNDKAFLSWARRNDLLITDNRKKCYTKRTRIGDGLYDSICLKIPGLNAEESVEDMADDPNDPPF